MRRTELYEPERKEAFLAACYSDETQKENVRTLLESLGEQEKRIGKDFCQMTPEEVHTALVGVVGSRYRSSTARKVPLQKYVSWCIENGIPGANPVLDGVSFTDAGKDKLASQSVGSPMQLQKYMDCIFDMEEADTVDLIYRGFFSGWPSAEFERKHRRWSFQNPLLISAGISSIFREKIMRFCRKQGRLFPNAKLFTASIIPTLTTIRFSGRGQSGRGCCGDTKRI